MHRTDLHGFSLGDPPFFESAEKSLAFCMSKRVCEEDVITDER
jgi:hypothetical protein